MSFFGQIGLEKALFVAYTSHMPVQTTQVRVTLPLQLSEILLGKAERLGLGLATYLKHLAISDAQAKDDEFHYPEYEASERTLLAFRDAMRDKKEGKMIRVDDIDAYFDSL